VADAAVSVEAAVVAAEAVAARAAVAAGTDATSVRLLYSFLESFKVCRSWSSRDRLRHSCLRPYSQWSAAEVLIRCSGTKVFVP